MKNIFENAYFGKPYRTRGGNKALYIGYNNFTKYAMLIVDGFEHSLYDSIAYYVDGTLVMGEINNPEDIISEWEEEISEAEADKLAETEANNTVGEWRYGSTDLPKWHGFKEGFKVGLRKVLVYINNNKK